MKIAYLGPEESYTHIACKKIFASQECDLINHRSISDIIEKLSHGEVDQAVVPVENSIEGGVNETMDALLQTETVFINHEYIMPIQHCLLAKDKTASQSIDKILAHPMSFAQCRKYIHYNCAHAELENTSSNSAAALTLSQSAETRWAVIASEPSAKAYGLEIIAKEINDESNNATRFFVLSRASQPASGKDKSSVIFQTNDEPGALIKILNFFADQGINLSRIISRPSRKQLGEYMFYLDLEAHREDSRYVEAIKNAKMHISFYKWLGSYNKLES